ncbi:MAG TPA: type II toxin-antitoxin system PemK/MazF family toxin [Pirellulales bacterium]|nr:type II toxin-antitoxin system PemK/MazF family toxin [Pirellulales bacterium]
MEIRLVLGRVVWATVPDPQGRNPKSRRCVVISDVDPSDPPNDVTVVYVTSSMNESYADEYVTLKHGPRCLTSFTKLSAAHCIGVYKLPVSEVTLHPGIVEPTFVEAIRHRIDALGSRVVVQVYPFAKDNSQ